jgi:hypothetical protein
VFFYIDRIAKLGVEGGATYALGVPTTLSSADVGVFSGEFAMSGLNVANPGGFQSPHFLRLGDGGVAVGLGSLMKETVRLPHLTLAELDVNLERRGGKSNYKTIMDNLKRLESGDKPADRSGGEKRFIVNEVDIRNVTINVDLLPAGGDLTRVTFPIEQIRLTDVGSDTDKGVLLAELSGVLIKAIIAAAAQKGGEIIPADVLGDLQSQLAQLQSLGDMGIGLLAGAEGQLQEITGQFGEVGKELEKAVGELEGVGEKAGEALKGIGELLGGDKEKDG